MKFLSKGRTLINIKKNVKGINIPESYCFKVREFKKNPKKIIKIIKEKFKDQIVIRSSAHVEDKKKESLAGKFKSFLNISPNKDLEVLETINQVIKSYKNYSSFNDEVLIQSMVKNIKMSGVIMTRYKNNSAPYNIIEYSLSSKSDDITSGTNQVKSFTYFKNQNLRSKKIRIRKCDKLIKILEKNFIQPLDIEFAINNKNKIYLLQVRELLLKNKISVNDNEFNISLLKLKKKITKLQKRHYSLLGKKTVFGVMPDWNPAEMIGIKPKKLAYSLYEELITNHVWADQRKSFGYRDLTAHHLLTNFFGTPFVDIRVDFNSWIPDDLDDKISEKLVNFYTNKFCNNLYLHDKIEFNIILTCATLDINEKIKDLKKSNFKDSEIRSIKKNLINVTNKSILNFKQNHKNLNILEYRNKKINNSNIYLIDKIYWLLEDCKKYGTFTVAGAARCGFIAVEMLESMVRKKIINQNEKNKFLNSIETISSKISKDFIKLDKNKFIQKHGHIRPNTYDIDSKNYSEAYSQYFDKKQKNKKILIKSKKFNFSKDQIKIIQLNLDKNSINITAKKLILFVSDAIKFREYSKYVFSKNVSDILKYIKILFKRNKIDLSKAGHVSIKDITNLYYNLSTKTIKETLEAEIKKNYDEFKINQLFKLPDNIINHDDVYQFHNHLIKSNYITNKKVLAKKYYFNFKTINKMKNKIVLIENADPGYDFIFTKNIKGLITKYGGANSHMAIRCAELDIPAAIGVGENNFKDYKNASIIDLDCSSKTVKVL
jgi:phosphohistidine swiveling domain-containing protein